MKRVFCIVLCLLIMLACSACENDNNEKKEEQEVDTAGNLIVEEVVEPEKTLLPFENGLTFILNSGTGNWETTLVLDNEGGIYGDFHDLNMGEVGEGYENGTYYWNEFWGYSDNIEKVNDYSYKFILKDVATSQPGDVEELDDEDSMLFKTTYNIEGVVDESEYILYLPNTPVMELPEESLFWLKNIEADKDVIDCYILYCVKNGDTFWCEV